MTEPTVTFTEAPASCTVKFYIGDYDAMLTLRDMTGQALLAKLPALLSTLGKMGATPTYRRRDADPASNGQATNGNAQICPTHGKPMKESQHGGWFCPVKIADDDGSGKPVYCKAKKATP